jgi:enoyl-CoA hydratase/carnithine racemase
MGAEAGAWQHAFVTGYETILWEVEDGVGWLTLNRPEVHNAFSFKMQNELRDVWRRARGDDDVRCIVLTGAGEKAFCVGIDRMEAMGTEPSEREGHVGGVGGLYQFDDVGDSICPKQNDLWKPVVAAVNGMACGGALYMLGECDIIIAADHATFFDPHVTYGMPAVFEPLLMLHRGMPFGEVLRMTLLGNHERLSAARALEIGLVSEVCPAAELTERARWVAEAIASAPAGPIQATLRTLWAGRELSRRQALDLGNTFLNLGMSEESLAEGQRTFASGQRIAPRIR